MAGVMIARVGATEAARISMLEEHRAAIKGVAQVFEALQQLPDEVLFLKARIISNLLWVVTEFKPGTKHKIHGVRWRTPSAHELTLRKETKTVRHEHVIERRWMIEFLNAHPEAMEVAIWNYPACLVTTEEHLRLGTSKVWGWARYLKAGLDVVDGETGRKLDLKQADSELRAKYEELGGL